MTTLQPATPTNVITAPAHADGIAPGEALIQIHRLMSGREWNPDTIANIAEILEEAGLPVADASDEAGVTDADVSAAGGVSPTPPGYRVSWIIDLEDRDDPVAAAREAWVMMRDPDTTATTMTVQDYNTGTVTDIDLADISNTATEPQRP